jgi:hypothetical protein
MAAQGTGFNWLTGLIAGVALGTVFLAAGAGPVCAAAAFVVAFALGAFWRRIT